MLYFLSRCAIVKVEVDTGKGNELSFPINDYLLANRRPRHSHTWPSSQSILLRRIAMHHKAPRSCSTTCIAKHFRSRGSSSTWLPRGGSRVGTRRAGWEGSKGKKGSLALDRLLLAPRKLPLVRNMFYSKSLPTFSRHSPVRSPLRHYPQLCSLFAPSCSSVDQRNRMNDKKSGVSRSIVYFFFCRLAM